MHKLLELIRTGSEEGAFTLRTPTSSKQGSEGVLSILINDHELSHEAIDFPLKRLGICARLESLLQGDQACYNFEAVLCPRVWLFAP
jgi:hypothetical protein